MTGALLFLNAWGQQLAVTAKQETGSSWIFFSSFRKLYLFQHNKLTMAANVGETNHETDKLELYPLISSQNI